MEQAGNTYLNNSSELSYVHSNTVLPDTATASELRFVFITRTASLACAFLRGLQQQEHKEKQDPTEWYQHKSRLYTNLHFRAAHVSFHTEAKTQRISSIQTCKDASATTPTPPGFFDRTRQRYDNTNIPDISTMSKQ